MTTLCSESLFRTCKYRPDYPAGGFVTIDAARDWIARFVQWYHHAHRHRSLRYITPAQRHAGLDGRIFAKRHQLYRQAKATHTERWTGPTRCWEAIGNVWLNQRSGTPSKPHERSKRCMTKHDDYLDTHRRERTLACGQVVRGQPSDGTLSSSILR